MKLTRGAYLINICIKINSTLRKSNQMKSDMLFCFWPSLFFSQLFYPPSPEDDYVSEINKIKVWRWHQKWLFLQDQCTYTCTWWCAWATKTTYLMCCFIHHLHFSWGWYYNFVFVCLHMLLFSWDAAINRKTKVLEWRGEQSGVKASFFPDDSFH